MMLVDLKHGAGVSLLLNSHHSLIIEEDLYPRGYSHSSHRRHCQMVDPRLARDRKVSQ